MKAERIAGILFITGCIICMLQVWLPAYYITGDGPCHVYNAQVVHDMWAGSNTAFYEPFYTLAYRADPNWLATFVIALLIFIVKAVVAEKIFLTLYIALYIGGFYALLKKLAPNATYWLLTVFLLVFSLTFAKGFYNFSFSIAFYFWVVYCWLRLLERMSVWRAIALFVFIGSVFFTHLLAFGFAAFTCAALLLSYTLAGEYGGKRVAFLGRYSAFFTLFFGPFLLLMVSFADKRGGLKLHLQHHFYRAVELVQGKFLVCVRHEEIPVALVVGVVLLLLLVVTLVRYKRYRAINKYDGFLISLFFALFVYLFFPDSFLGTLVLIAMRVQLFVLALIVCCIAYILPEGKLKNMAGIVLFTCFVVLSAFRISCQLRASSSAADQLSVSSHIRPNSVVLPLNFSPNGTDEDGQVIADRNFLFVHTAQYLGTIKPLIVLDNYEANMGYFPIRWKDRTDPYYHLSNGNDSTGGIEGVPPSADIGNYYREGGVAINYIIMWCYEPSFLTNGPFKTLYEEINAGYHLIYTSPSKRTRLFEKN